MEIKMPIKFHGSYLVTIRHSGFEKRETCQKLAMTALAGKDSSSAEESSAPTHLITYYSFGCKRMVEGKLKENREDKAIFEADNREYEFAPSESIC